MDHGPFKELPGNDAKAYRYVQRMFGAMLGDFQGLVSKCDRLLADAVNFIAEYEAPGM